MGIGLTPLQQVKFGWTEFSGDFLAPAGKSSIMLLHVTVKLALLNVHVALIIHVIS